MISYVMYKLKVFIRFVRAKETLCIQRVHRTCTRESLGWSGVKETNKKDTRDGWCYPKELLTLQYGGGGEC